MFIEKYVAKKVLGGLRHRRSNGENLSHDGSMSYESKKRLGRIPKTLGVIALAGATVTAGVFGVQRAMDRNQLVTHDTVAQGGEAEIISFNADYEAHCWTATTLQVTGAGVKEETKLMGASVGWKESKVDTQVENNLCIDATSLAFEVNTKTKHVTIDIPNKDDIRTQTNVVLGTIKPHQDQTVGYALTNNAVTFLESIPVIEDTAMSKDLSSAQDKQASSEVNVGLILAAKTANDKCHDEIWSLAKNPVEKGLGRMAGLGMTVTKAMYPELNIDPANISVTVEGKPIGELTVAGNVTSIDAAYESIKKFDEGNDSFSILQPADSTCKVSDEVNKIPAETKPVVQTQAKVGSNE